MSYGVVSGQLRRMDKQQQRRAGTVQTDSMAFTLHPTCPPSTNVTFRGGYAWQVVGYLIEYGWYTPSYTVDLTDPNKVSVRGGSGGYTYTFTNPYWYAPCLFVISNNMDPPEPPDTWPAEIENYRIYLYGRIGVVGVPPYLTEYETAGEAEDGCWQIVGAVAAGYGVVVGGIILRNNGNITDANQYEPVDVVNRGRSYLFGEKRYGWNFG